MQFITNRIKTGPSKSFDDLLKEHASKKQIKTAAVKIAEEDEAESSGQLEVEPLHQDGESTTMPKAGPNAKKEGEDDTSKEKEATAIKQDEEGKDSGHAKWDGTSEHQNDPEVEDDAKGGSSGAKTKEADIQCNCGCKTCPACGCDKCEAAANTDTKVAGGCSCCDDKCGDCSSCKSCKPCTASSDSKTKKAGKLPDALKEHQFKAKDSDDKEKEAKDEKEDKEEKEAAVTKFVKIANLDGKNKSFLRTYWTKLFGEDFTNALLADK